MDIYATKGHKVKFISCSDSQIRWGGHDDPKGILDEGNIYEVDHTIVHGSYTEVYLIGYEKYEFNSACFEDIEEK